MKNKIRNNATKSKNLNNLNSIYDFIFKISKIMVLSVFSICLCVFFVFEITYMNSNRFFSYDLLSLEHIWIFVFIFIKTCIFALLYLPLNIALYNYRRANCFVAIIFFALFTLFVVAVVVAAIDNQVKDWNWTYFCLSTGFFCFLIIESFIQFNDDKNKQKLYVFLLIAFLAWFSVVFIKLEAFNVGFKTMLTEKSLAADKVEIYLKDKNKFVCGKMVFRDSKFAYVLYNDIDSNTNCIDLKEPYALKKLVPIENVTILNPLPKDSQSQK